MGIVMTKNTAARIVPWIVVVVLCVSSIFTHRYAYKIGERRGARDAAKAGYDLMVLDLESNLRLLIAALSASPPHLSRSELLPLRARLKGTLAFAQSVLNSTDKDSDLPPNPLEIQKLLKRATDLDRELGPLVGDDEGSQG